MTPFKAVTKVRFILNSAKRKAKKSSKIRVVFDPAIGHFCLKLDLQ